MSQQNQKEKAPLIFEFEDYRVYLKKMYEYKKRTHPGFSYRAFSKSAGLKSTNYLKLVIDNQRNLSAEAIEKFIRALGLDASQAAYFRNLVHLNQVISIEEKRYFADQILGSKKYKKAKPLRAAQYACYSQWYIFPIRELIATKDFQEDPKWIAKTLVPNITPAEAQNALDQLINSNMITRNADGKLVQSEVLVSSGDEVPGIAIAEFHREMIKKGRESIERFEGKVRDVSSVTLGLSEQTAQEVREKVQKFRKELMDIAAKEKKATKVVQVNFQLFPLSKNPGEGS